jgi:hypothetical protein
LQYATAPWGCRINVLRGTPMTYPAGQPFFIHHSVNSGCSVPPQSAGKEESEACAVAVAVDGYPGPCANPAQQVEFFTSSVTVTFTG